MKLLKGECALVLEGVLHPERNVTSSVLNGVTFRVQTWSMALKGTFHPTVATHTIAVMDRKAENAGIIQRG